MRKLLAFFFILICVSFCLLYGLQEKQKAEEKIEHEVVVELVIVEVFVTDKKGNFVDNLTKDDFEIYEDGEKVEIKYFAVVTPEKEIPREKVIEEIKKEEEPQRPKKMKLVILFDNINTNRFYLKSQWPQIQEMFNALSGKVEETMIMELNRGDGARIIQPFTSDQNVLSRQMSKFKAFFWKEVEEEVLESQISDIIESARAGFLPDAAFLIGSLRKEEQHIKRRRLADSFSAFLNAVNYIRRFEGTKSVLIVSDGFNVRFGNDNIVRIFDPFKLFGGKKYFTQQEAFEKFLKLINEERLIFYAFSPKPWTIRESSEWSRELYSLERIAGETGGVYLRGEKKYENFVKELGRDLTHFYDISYTPPKRTKKGGYHRIEMKVKKPGLIIRFKKGYSDFTPDALEKRLTASAFLSPSLFRDIAFACRTDFISLIGEYPQAWIRMLIPLGQFKAEPGIISPEKLTMMFGIDERAEQKVHFGEIEVPLKGALERESEFLYYAFSTSGLKLKPGEYDFRVILKWTGERIGGWEETITIPDREKELPLSIINSIFGFLRENTGGKSVPFSLSKEDGSLLLSRYKFFPSVATVFKKTEDVAIYLQDYAPVEIGECSLQFSVSQDEKKPQTVPSQKIESCFDKKTKILNRVYRLDFHDIAPGKYRLKIQSSDNRIEKEVEIKII